MASQHGQVKSPQTAGGDLQHRGSPGDREDLRRREAATLPRGESATAGDGRRGVAAVFAARVPGERRAEHQIGTIARVLIGRSQTDRWRSLRTLGVSNWRSRRLPFLLLAAGSGRIAGLPSEQARQTDHQLTCDADLAKIIISPSQTRDPLRPKVQADLRRQSAWDDVSYEE